MAIDALFLEFYIMLRNREDQILILEKGEKALSLWNTSLHHEIDDIGEMLEKNMRERRL